MPNEARLTMLLTRWEEQHHRGRDLSAAELCADCPQLLSEVERRIQTFKSMKKSRRPGGSAATTTPEPGNDTTPHALPEVPGYEIVKEVGRGAMGVVYQARQTGLKREVALKMIRAGGQASTEDRSRFRQEAEAIARLHHPNVVQIYEVGEAHDQPYFALEFVPGGTLARRLDGEPQPTRWAAELVEVLARAMAVAHEQSIVHRDLKPGNILLGTGGTPKITDFGLAKLLNSDARHTQSGALVGTPAYMAPEQAQGMTSAVGPLTDVYALGAILYECLTGRPPFQAPTTWETITRVVADEPIAPSQLRPGVPRDLEAICLCCLAKAPAARYPNALALAEDLQRFQQGLPTRVRPVGLGRRFALSVRRHPILAGLMVVLLSALVAVPILLHYFDPERPRREVESDLAKGKTVFLRGNQDVPGPFRWVVGEPIELKENHKEECFSLKSTTLDTALLELASDPFHESFRFTAEMRMDGAAETGAVGLYFGHVRDTSQGVPQHGFFTVGYNDRGIQIPDKDSTPGWIDFHYRYLEERAGTPFAGQKQMGRLRSFAIQPGFGNPSPWRKLEVQATAEELLIYWGQERQPMELIGRVSRQVLWTARKSLYEDALRLVRLTVPLEKQPALIGGTMHGETLRSGLGFYIHKSIASFRRICVEPLDEAP